MRSRARLMSGACRSLAVRATPLPAHWQSDVCAADITCLLSRCCEPAIAYAVQLYSSAAVNELPCFSVIVICSYTVTPSLCIQRQSQLALHNCSAALLAGKDMAFKDLPHSLEAADVEGASQPQNPAEPVHKVRHATCCFAPYTVMQCAPVHLKHAPAYLYCAV